MNKSKLYENLSNDCTFIRINQKISPKRWTLLRLSGIGGSDAGAIMEMNDYSTPLSVYLQKKRLVESFKGNAATEWGHILEDPIMIKTSKELDVTIEKVPGMLTSLEYEFMNANLDGLIYAEHDVTLNGETVKGLGGYEIKTSANGLGFDNNEIPDSYYCQVQHYMTVTNLDWFILTVFILSQRIAKHYIVRRNPEFIQLLIEKESNFWENNVLKNCPPAPTGNEKEIDLLKSLPMEEAIELPEEFLIKLEEKKSIDDEISNLKKKSDIIKEEILIKMSELSRNAENNNEKSIAVCGNWSISLSTSSRKSIDSSALKKAGLYDKFVKESVSTTLRISQKKEK